MYKLCFVWPVNSIYFNTLSGASLLITMYLFCLDGLCVCMSVVCNLRLVVSCVTVRDCSSCLLGRHTNQLCFLFFFLNLPFPPPLPFSFLFFFTSQMASAVLKGVCKYSLVHCWSLESCQQVHAAFLKNVERGVEWIEGAKWGFTGWEERERGITFYPLLLCRFGVMESHILSSDCQYIALFLTKSVWIMLNKAHIQCIERLTNMSPSYTDI